MYQVAVYEQIRRAYYVEGKSGRAIAKEYGLSRKTVKKMLFQASSPGYCRKKDIGFPRIGPYKDFIAQILAEDKQAPRKQRHTGRRIYERLKEEQGYEGSYSAVQRYICKYKPQSKEVFIPLSHPFGTAQADFGEAYVKMSGERLKIHYCVISLVNSDRYFVQAYPQENAQAFCDAHVKTFDFFKGVPWKILYDNSGVIVRFEGKTQKRHFKTAFYHLKSHYLFQAEFCAPGKGNEKGHIENKVGFIRRNFFTPVPACESFEDLNEQLREFVLQSAQKSTQEEKQQKDQDALLPLASVCFEACHITPRKVNKLCLVRYKGNEYSVPSQYAYQMVILKAFYDKIEIYAQSTLIAQHQRSYGQEEQVLDYRHYLDIIYRKIRSLNQAKALKQRAWPPCFEQLYQRLKAEGGKEGERESVNVLRLTQLFPFETLTKAIKEGLKRGRYDALSIKHLILWQTQTKPSWLEAHQLQNYPSISVQSPNLAVYDQLLPNKGNPSR